jgi:hypothetical protein
MPVRNPPQQFIFRPGATATRFDAGVRVYTDFVQLYDDLTATEGLKTIIFDDSISSPCTIPVNPTGSYSFTDTKWSSSGFSQGSDNGVAVTFAAGALVLQPPEAFEGVEVTLPVGVATPFPYGSNRRIPMRNCRFNTTTGGNPMFSVTGTQTVFQVHNTRFSGSGNIFVVVVTGSITFSLAVSGDTLITPVTISTPVGSIFVEDHLDTSAVVATQIWISGTHLVNLSTDALSLDYNPSTPGDWPVVPANVEEALDTVAAQAESGDGGTVYVSKAGSDSYSGLSPTRAKLTISAAVTVAATFGFAAVVRVLDGGTYNEGVTLPGTVSLEAPYAHISTAGTALTVGSSSSVRVRKVTSTASSGVEALSGGVIDIDEVDVSGAAIAVKLAGTAPQHVDIRHISFSTGIGVECSYTSFGQLYGNFGIITGGTGVCIQQVTGNAIGSVYCTAKRLQGSGPGISISGGSVQGDYQVVAIEQSTAFNVVGTSTLNIVATRVVGSTVGAGTVNVVKAI